MKRALLLLLLVLWAAPLGAQPACPPAVAAPTPAEMQAALQAARDRGALWRFEKDGRAGYLYGTIHVGKLEWAMPGPVLRQALTASDTVAIEVNPLDPAVQAAVLKPAPAAEVVSVPPPLLDRLRKQAARACVPWERIEALPPTLIAVTLAVLEARWEGLHVDYASEVVLVGIANAARKQLASLETGSIQRDALLGGTPADQVAVIENTVQGLENGSARRELAGIANAWAGGDLEGLARLMAQSADIERKMVQRLVIDRNPAMATRIEELHRTGAKLFVATGILHMVGDAGLPRLLAGRGFTVERLAFDGR
jgi:uncharacterized protein YbaP (TraB family)